MAYCGACKLCDPSWHHVQLEACTDAACHCEEFDDPAMFGQCFNCLHDSSKHGGSAGDIEFNQLKAWVGQGIKQEEILNLYRLKFNVDISLRTLQRKLADYRIMAVDTEITDENILDAVRMENRNGVVGYHRMHCVLRTKRRLFVSRNRLYHIMRSDDNIPKGKDPKVDGRKYHQKPFSSEGSDWLWAMDGHEKLAQDFGLYIYGVIDTFSRKVLSLKVLPDKKMMTISKWLIGEINTTKGKPKTLMMDKGTEWNDIVPNLSIIQMKSTFNQKIEAFWSQLSLHSDIVSFKSVLRRLERDGLFTVRNENDRWALWMSFQRPLQISLNAFREIHNAHKIRRQKGVDLPTGYSPDLMYEHPEIFNKENYLQPMLDSIPTPETEDISRKYRIPEELRRKALATTKDDCLQVYDEIREAMLQL